MWTRDGSTMQWSFERPEDGYLKLQFIVNDQKLVSVLAWDEDEGGEGTREITLGCGLIGDGETLCASISTALVYVSNGAAYDQPDDDAVADAVLEALKERRR